MGFPEGQLERSHGDATSTPTTEPPIGHENNENVRAHSGHKSKRTAACMGKHDACAIIRQFATAEIGEVRQETASKSRRKSEARPPGDHRMHGNHGCGAPEGKQRRRSSSRRCNAAVPVARTGATKRCRSLSHQTGDAELRGKRSHASVSLCASVPEPVCQPAPDARLGGRGWHDRWPPPVRATQRGSQLSLREAFARPSPAPSRASLAVVDVEAVANVT